MNRKHFLMAHKTFLLWAIVNLSLELKNLRFLRKVFMFH